MNLLVLNSGSSSIKFALFSRAPGADPVLACRGEIEGIAGGVQRFFAVDADGQALLDTSSSAQHTHAGALADLLDWLEQQRSLGDLGAVGHRVVHGGQSFTAPALIDAGVLKELAALIPLAPLHQPHNLAAIRALAVRNPAIPQVACFDTAFHHTQPAVARHFALPRDLTAAGVLRYGFHGLSYTYIAGELAAAGAGSGRVIVAHLGNGASMCALRDGRSQATSMGFTALDGLPMGTRCGALDPGVVLYLQENLAMNAAEVNELLYHRSGLLGVSAVSNDMRVLLASDDPRAAEAVALFIYRIGRELGSLAAALGGLDALVFTGGIGEHSAEVRARVCAAAKWLGVRLDEAANAAHADIISAAGSAVSVRVIPTDEERVIARSTCALLDRKTD
ncbi:acetate/propionate family kinase [Exilibacterium tricleocarpae]|uniref:Acetate kinase n=1 Tax=Exilibacterium tricleocarpae TaxID=2591008 RepID=A0A545SZ17_9GAMM|nr:acetate/propionate family kinase [Exilibacterium tricleocarpae]TQV70216.1 acetate/propionate family kinase [Exilibacterium tricleocarpae]